MINIAIKLATSITYTANGSQTNFSVPFDYLRPSFVHVAVNDAEVSEGFTISNRMVMFDSAPAKDAVVYIYRSTPTTRLVSWADASILKAIDMTIAEVQQLHILEEANDWSKTHSIVFDEERGVWQGRNYRVSNVSDPTEAQDVVTKNYLENTEDSFVQRMNAIKTQTEQFANTAGNSKDSAYKSAQTASTSAASAAESARLAEGYKTAAETASNFAAGAQNSAREAKTYRDNAKTYMDNAKNYSENVNVFTPSVSTSGVLSWTNKAGLANPPSVNIKGEKGDQGLQGVQGDTGAKGDRGATGAAATVRIGTVTTGAPGSEAIVTNVGTANDAVFNFTLPRGDKGADGGIDVDAELSDTSTNPIQNKAVNTAINTVKNNMTQGFQTINASIPTKVSALENDAGYLNMGTLPIFPSTDSANTWKGRQTFNEAMLREAMLIKARIVKEVYQSEYINGTTVTPTKSTMCLVTTGATTLDMTTIVAECLGNNRNSTVFTAYITSDADYPLTITNAGTLKYIGSASDVAITSAGLLLNILMVKDASGTVTSIVQASKLEGGA
nr:MAG TPA: tail fiber protein [Bacteriophage sp.]